VLGGFSPPLIEPGHLTVAEFLRRQGYHTAVMGKWHLGLDWARAARRDLVNPRPQKKSNAKAKTKAAAKDDSGASIDFTQPFGRRPTALGFDEFFGISASLDMPPYTYLANDRVATQPDRVGNFPMKNAHPDCGKVNFTQRAIDYFGRRAAEVRAGKPFFLYLPLASPHTPSRPRERGRAKAGSTITRIS
jgi:arylsulfatase A-like enzyme